MKSLRPYFRPLFFLAALSVAVLGATAGYVWLTRLAFFGTEESVSFRSQDGVTLRATLYLPSTPGPHPAMVLLHGAGPELGSAPVYRLHMKAFAEQGFAVLLYDKRGVGDSEGNFENATFREFIEDALAAIGYLRSRADIRPDGIGVLGSSEGGWFTPEIAARDGRLAFIVNRCGPPVSWMDTNRWQVRNELRAAGVADEQMLEDILALRVALWTYYIDAAKAGEALSDRRQVLSSELNRLDGPWRSQVRMKLADFDLDTYRRWAVDMTYDPTPWMQQLSVPLLSVFGELDQSVPAALSERALGEFNSDLITVHVYQGRGHSLQTWTDMLNGGYASDYLPRISGWARAQVDRQSESVR